MVNIPMARMSSRQKDKFIENVMKLAETSNDNGFERKASSPFSQNVSLDKAEAAFNTAFNGVNGLKRVSFAINCVAPISDDSVKNSTISVELPTSIREVDNTEERPYLSGMGSVETRCRISEDLSDKGIVRATQECVEADRNVQPSLEEKSKLDCAICGESYINLGRHLSSTHQVNVEEYKRLHNLKSTASSELSKRRSDNIKKTFLEKYGVSNISYLPIIGKKIAESRKRNGKHSAWVQRAKASGTMGFQRRDVQDKCSVTLTNKYGGRGLASPNLKRKAKDTCLVRYGVENPMEVQRFAHKCFSKQCERPNYPEKLILDLGKGRLTYTGDASFRIVLKTGKTKYPDFIVEPIAETRKIVEHYGNHFHTLEELQSVDRAYREAGFIPLFIWYDETKDPVKLQGKIDSFLLN